MLADAVMLLALLLQKNERPPVFFDGWYSIGRTAVLAVLAYIALVVMIRIAGKRSLAKMNVYDFVTIIVIGSALATSILSADVVLLDGITALVVLLGLQYFIAFGTVRSHGFERFVNGDPVLLVHRGRLLKKKLKSERISDEEIHAAIRNAGLGEIEQVETLVLETDGTFTVIERDKAGKRTSLVDVKGFSDR